MDDHVAPINRVATPTRLPGLLSFAFGRERFGTLTFSTAVVLEGSLVRSVCIRVVATHNLVGGTPLQEKKEKSKRKEVRAIELSPSGSRLSHHVRLGSGVLHELVMAPRVI